MGNSNKSKSKTIAYDYLFNYFGGDIFKNKVICGATINLAIRAYKNGKEVKFSKEPVRVNGYSYCHNYKVSFDRNKLFVVEKNIKADNSYRIEFGWDKIDCEVVGYELDYWYSELCSVPMRVTREEFETFLRKHLDDFDISDNKNAQVPSMIFI